MKLPLSWLKEYVEVDISAKELAEKLLGCGFEVEEIIYKGKDIENVVVGKILSMEKHPDADRLSVCQVDVGEGAPLQVVTGASNVSDGDYVPVALCGAKLKGGITIKEGKLRGVSSYGMLCSGAELGIDGNDYEGASADGILILKGEQTCGEDIKKVLGLDEYILDISITANRNDCQGIYGMAREVAAALNKPLRPLDLRYEEDGGDDIGNYVDVEVVSPKLCPRYIARCVKDIVFTETPDWMKKRLRLCGIRPINIIVDITNYVLLETGQPMHAFDARFIGGKKIVVRQARKNEKIITLDGKESALTGQMLVICDENKPIALAGIMGGEHSGIIADTRVTVFESAKFARDSIRKTSRALNIRSDSSTRFERGVDAYTCRIASERALALVYRTGCGKIVGGIKDILSEELKTAEISVEKQKIDDILGIDVPKDAMTKILNALEFKAEFEGDVLRCEIPLFRTDIEGYPDLAEEIIRYYGYDKLRPTILADAAITKGGKERHHLVADEIKLIMTAQGFNEIITYTFINQNAFDKLNIDSASPLRDTIKLLNPLSEQMAVMRTLAAHSMLERIAFNLNKKNNSGRLFEIGSVFLKKSESALPYENRRLCIGCYGNGEDFFTLKGCVDNLLEQLGIDAGIQRGNQPFMHGGRCADIFIGGNLAGYYGEIHPDVAENYEIKQRVYLCEIDFDMLLSEYKGFKGYENIPRFPQIERDLAVVVKEGVTCRQITDEIKAAGGRLLKSAELFDYYKGDQIEEGFVSMAFSLTIGDDDRTLKVEDADKVIENILAGLENKYSAKLR
jgi:phenylalanyl-tRNA synthetase beta chain